MTGLFTDPEILGGLLGWSVEFALWCISIAGLLSGIRLVIGPTLADRIVALDLMSILAVAFIAAFALGSGQKEHLDVALALALVAFLATLAFGRYIELKAIQDEADRDAAAAKPAQQEDGHG